jgi:hypothetical protein
MESKMNILKINDWKDMPEKYTGIVETNDGSRHWYLNGELHRIGGPAVELINEDKEWHLNGKLHRVDGPAVEYADGHKVWYFNGKLHRVDGPAIEHANGEKAWYLNWVNYSQEEWFEQLSEEDKVKAIWNLK